MAFDQGLAHPETLIDDRAVAFDGYAPQNFDGAFRGEIPIREALRQSLNIPVVLLTHELGPTRVMARLQASGAAPKLPGGKPGLALALGALGSACGIWCSFTPVWPMAVNRCNCINRLSAIQLRLSP